MQRSGKPISSAAMVSGVWGARGALTFIPDYANQLPSTTMFLARGQIPGEPLRVTVKPHMVRMVSHMCSGSMRLHRIAYVPKRDAVHVGLGDRLVERNGLVEQQFQSLRS